MSIDASLSKEAKSVLVSIDTGTHSTTWSGIWAGGQPGDLEYQVIGNSVQLFLPYVNNTATISDYIYMDTVLPASLRPVNPEDVTIFVEDDGVFKIGKINIDMTGSIYIYSDENYSLFSGTGLSGFQKCSIHYNLT